MTVFVSIFIVLGILLFFAWNIYGLVRDIKENKKKKDNANVDSENKDKES